jgi:hypothetical protein
LIVRGSCLDNPQKILVRSPNWIGDAVISLPALAALRGRFPGAEIVLAAHRQAADFLQRLFLGDDHSSSFRFSLRNSPYLAPRKSVSGGMQRSRMASADLITARLWCAFERIPDITRNLKAEGFLTLSPLLLIE